MFLFNRKKENEHDENVSKDVCSAKYNDEGKIQIINLQQFASLNYQFATDKSYRLMVNKIKKHNI